MEEAPVVVTAATGAIGPVVAKLSALLRRRGERAYWLRRRTRKDVKLIRSKLKSIHSVLWVIWEREDLDAAGKELKMEAWRLADDMNDATDDFILSLKRSNDGRRFAEEDKAQPRPFQDLKRGADDVSERCRNKWKMETAHTTISSLFSRRKPTVDDSAGLGKRHRVVDPYVHNHKDISELVDMEEQRDELIQHLVGDEESTRQLKMACIVGAAGVGKTTLARLVYEAKAIEDKFQARAFVSISSSRRTTEVLASILQQIAGLPDNNTAVPLAGTKEATEKHLIGTISNFLEDKRYLVIVDDIWHYGEWTTIKMSLPDNHLGSRIVTTSHVIAITKKWRDDFDALVYEIYPLETGVVQEMINMKPDVVGEDFDHDHGIVEMCRGIPLAVDCMMSALAKEQEHQKQQGLHVVRTRDVQDRIEEQVKRNGIQNTPGFQSLVESLELGYNHLPHHMLKTCLLYCSIYPEDHRFKRDDWIRRWIAEGFVCKEEAAEDYFDELVSRGLFQKFVVGIDSYFNRVCPMMRDYLRGKLREVNFITFTSDGVPSYRVGRLCIDYWPSSDSVEQMDTMSEIDWHHIRSLVVFEDAERVPYKHLQHLRVLDVQYNDVLEQQHLMDMCGLLRLRHLFVSGGHRRKGITEMPAEIARLQYLETLEVRYTGIRRLPAQMGDLKQLKTLVMSGNTKLTELPREMEKLQHVLETLIIRGSKIREQAWEIIGTLKKLKILDVSRNGELSGIPRDIGELQQLKNLDVSRNPRITELPKEIGELQQLKNLDVSETRIKELPCEISNLQRLEALCLARTGIRKLPRDIGKLQNLERLDVWSTNVKKIPRQIGELKKLKIISAEIGTLPFEAGQLSKLARLPKCVGRAWKNSDLVSSLAGEILSFEITDLHGGDGGLIVGTKHMHIPQWIKEHFNNIGTLDIRICKLEEQDLKILREMPDLYELVLRFEGFLRKPIVISSGGFAKLRTLTVDSRVPRITFQEGAMLRLRELTFEFQFYGGPPNTEHPMGIKHLVSLYYVIFRCTVWYRADSPCISATIDIVRKEAREHPNSIRLEMLGKEDEFYPGKSIAQSSQDRNDACSSSAANQTDEIIPS